MKIVVITNSDQYEPRAEQFRKLLAENNEVIAYTTDFVHRTKTKRTESQNKDFILFPAKPYKKNLSVARLVSQWDFAKRVMKEIEKHSPDVIYCIIPANSFAYHAAKYKKKHPEVKLVFDIIDMWPESFPIQKIDWLPVFGIWKNIRDKHLKKAVAVTSECRLFLDDLGDAIKNVPTEVLYFSKKATQVDKTADLPDDSLNLCYLGSVNNIIDIDFISKLLSELSRVRKTKLHIIGNGERIAEFAAAAENAGAEVINHGVVYDAEEKQKIFNKCHFGINAMKSWVCVGLTMKSVDYLDAGLPLLNNIKGDTTRFVEQYGAGYNLSYENMSEAADKISKLSERDFVEMRKAAISVFEQNLSLEVFERSFKNLENKLENK